MSTMTVRAAILRKPYRVLLMLAPVLLLAACTSLPAPQTINQNFYILESPTPIPVAQVKHAGILAIGEPQARPGFDTAQIAYVQQPQELNYFVASRWVAPPAQMLAPLLVQALQQTESFRAVVATPGAVPADIRLDTELVRLQQNFATQPSRVQLTLRAQLIDARGKRVLAVKQFDEIENAASEDAYGGVGAANRALQRVLGQLAEFCINESTTH
jgi:cholesterol transport system auxiliary component